VGRRGGGGGDEGKEEKGERLTWARLVGKIIHWGDSVSQYRKTGRSGSNLFQALKRRGTLS